MVSARPGAGAGDQAAGARGGPGLPLRAEQDDSAFAVFLVSGGDGSRISEAVDKFMDLRRRYDRCGNTGPVPAKTTGTLIAPRKSQ